MKLIEELLIDKNILKIIEDSKVKIKKLKIVGINNDDIFYYDNLDFFLKNQFIDQILYVITYHSDKLNNVLKEKIKKIIIDSNDPYGSSYYAKDVLKDRWINDESLPLLKRKEIESKIASDNGSMQHYINNVIKGRWKEHEDKIAKSNYVTEYAKKFLKKRWVDVEDIDPKIAEEAEKNIFSSDSLLSNYVTVLVNYRWKKFEDNIDKINPHIINYYFNNIKKRLPELEDYISKNRQLAIFYVSSILKPVLNKTWSDMKGIISDKIIKQAEDSIYYDTLTAVNYSIDISKKRLPLEIENRIFNDYEVTSALRYLKEMIKGRSPQFEKNLIRLKKEIDNNNLLEYLSRTYQDDYQPADYNNANANIIYTLLAIYEYTKDVINGPWPKVGINNNEDFKNLRKKIINLDEWEFLDELREDEENDVELNY